MSFARTVSDSLRERPRSPDTPKTPRPGWAVGVLGLVGFARYAGVLSAFLEELVYEEAGQLVTGTLADYALPTAADFPCIESITPLSAKRIAGWLADARRAAGQSR